MSNPEKSKTCLDFFNKNLDKSQKEAVTFSLDQKEVAIIHGPPGTGKSTTLVEIIHQAAIKGDRVLVAANSNLAVDSLAYKLNKAGLDILRYGNLTRMKPDVRPISCQATNFNSFINKKHRELELHINELTKAVSIVCSNSQKEEIDKELNFLCLERKINSRKLEKLRKVKPDVTLCTLSGCQSKFLKEKKYDLVVIDECSQATEVASWMAVVKAPKFILAGDHHQLGPVVRSIQAKKGLEQSLMERLINLFEKRGDNGVRMLTTQYRMHQNIMKWSSNTFYDGNLIAHPSCANKLLKDLDGVSDDFFTSLPLLLIDTSGCDFTEYEDGSFSISNKREAKLVASHVHTLISLGVKPQDIAVISPYQSQIIMLRKALAKKYPQLEINTVDGFQGREKEAVIISMVRSNIDGKVGFLSDKCRMNVAVTRAKCSLTVVCDTKTARHDKYIRSLINCIDIDGEILSPHSYEDKKVQKKKKTRIN